MRVQMKYSHNFALNGLNWARGVSVCNLKWQQYQYESRTINERQTKATTKSVKQKELKEYGEYFHSSDRLTVHPSYCHCMPSLWSNFIRVKSGSWPIVHTPFAARDYFDLSRCNNKMYCSIHTHPLHLKMCVCVCVSTIMCCHLACKRCDFYMSVISTTTK